MLRILREMAAVYVGWTFLHWTFVNTYAYICTPSGGWGLFRTLLTSQAAYCSAIRSATYISGASMDQSLSVAFTWCLMRLGCGLNRVRAETTQALVPERI
ncbi:MAG: hypothetical protein CBC65_000170 [Rhodothermaceae bacterium TMED105]|nr:MAG: hypothetical protein CBC65_000170 [Rhodothermaceae bacterium TMED105]